MLLDIFARRWTIDIKGKSDIGIDIAGKRAVGTEKVEQSTVIKWLKYLFDLFNLQGGYLRCYSFKAEKNI